jgi:hypothetical protein
MPLFLTPPVFMEVFPRKRRRTRKKRRGRQQKKTSGPQLKTWYMMMFLPMSSTALLMSKEDIPDFTLFSLGSLLLLLAASLAWSFLREGNHASCWPVL